MKTKYIRYSRIIKHYIQYLFTADKVYFWECEHYWYMKVFTASIK